MKNGFAGFMLNGLLLCSILFVVLKSQAQDGSGGTPGYNLRLKVMENPVPGPLNELRGDAVDRQRLSAVVPAQVRTRLNGNRLADDDISCWKLETPGRGIYPDKENTFRVWVKSLSSLTESQIPVDARLGTTPGATDVWADQEVIPSLEPGQETLVAFDPFTPSAGVGTYYFLTVEVSYPGDPDPSNDVCQSYWVVTTRQTRYDDGDWHAFWAWVDSGSFWGVDYWCPCPPCLLEEIWWQIHCDWPDDSREEMVLHVYPLINDVPSATPVWSDTVISEECDPSWNRYEVVPPLLIRPPNFPDYRFLVGLEATTEYPNTEALCTDWDSLQWGMGWSYWDHHWKREQGEVWERLPNDPASWYGNFVIRGMVNCILDLPNLVGDCESELYSGLGDWENADSVTMMYDDGSHGDDWAADNIYSSVIEAALEDFVLTQNEGYQVVGYAGGWDPQFPGDWTANVPIEFSGGEAIGFYFDRNQYTDGFIPESCIVYNSWMSTYTWPGPHYLVGNCQDEFGASSDWNSSDTTMKMNDAGTEGDAVAGDLVYTYRGTCSTAGSYEFMVLNTYDSWQPQYATEGFVWDGGSNLSFSTSTDGNMVTFETDVARGRTRVTVGSAEEFIRADADANMSVEMSDAIYTLKFLYVPGSDSLSCMDAGDSDDNGTIAMADAIYTLKYLYVPGAPQPPAPGPTDCGDDPTSDGLDCAHHPCMGGGYTGVNEAKPMRRVKPLH